ncbi:adenosylcobinamide-GDP ribazoletransferase [Natranaerobius thermophilus]|uniref:Adenosylcobinamide-GDP ribazoletransferase n=1 Tax=Natranaerobius thermophilus (strain ATCC BAA-1301 / DSM 18059 / JW/NM-WN-LF) TaxID=457570 RepID=B2A0G5_NATTJ|nr:adenosylcobinamide-GDP ribazoletransferase [Natranaerobius thermophilus]ACB84526.1 cobalamin 5'-phosphate synthase [Natranaerobius thermophilus JW/NM-WN-LF]
MDKIKEIIGKFLGATSLLTRIPVPVWGFSYPNPSWTPYFPFVGLTLGTIYVIVDMLISPLLVPEIMAFFMVLLDIFLSGGLHLDGLADSFDGYFSGKTGTELLEIMRDSNVGAYGVIALWILLSGKWLLLSFIISMGEPIWLLLFPWAGRLIMWQVLISYPYPEGVRGMGEIIKDSKGFKTRQALMVPVFSIVIVLSLSLLLTGLQYDEQLNLSNYFLVILTIVATILVVGIVTNIFVKNFNDKLGGVTGDIYGASCEIGQLLVLSFGAILM